MADSGNIIGGICGTHRHSRKMRNTQNKLRRSNGTSHDCGALVFAHYGLDRRLTRHDHRHSTEIVDIPYSVGTCDRRVVALLL